MTASAPLGAVLTWVSARERPWQAWSEETGGSGATEQSSARRQLQHSPEVHVGREWVWGCQKIPSLPQEVSCLLMCARTRCESKHIQGGS